MILITEQVHAAGLDRLHACSDVEVLQAGVTDPAFLAALPAAEGIGVRIARLDAALLARAPRLRIVSKHGVGTDAIDVAWCTSRSIPVTVTPDANTVSVAEHTLMLMLAAAKRLHAYDTATREGHWAFRDSLAGVELAGRIVLVVGFGRIGRRVAELCRAFGMDVLVYTRSVTAVPFRTCPDLNAGLAKADVVTLHLPRTAETSNLFDAVRIGLMRPGAILVNCARGGIVDEAALAAALANGRVGAAGLDVFADEPFAPAHPLATLPNVVLTPHSGASTAEGARRMSLAMADNLLAGLDGTLTAATTVNPATLRSSNRV